MKRKFTINQFDGFGNETKPTNEPEMNCNYVSEMNFDLEMKIRNETERRNENQFKNEQSAGNELQKHCGNEP